MNLQNLWEMYELDVIRESNNGPKAIMWRFDLLARVLCTSSVCEPLSPNPAQLGGKGLTAKEGNASHQEGCILLLRLMRSPGGHVIITEEKCVEIKSMDFEI